MKKLMLLTLFILSQITSAQEAQPRVLDKDSLLMDIDWLEKALTEAHPGIYRYNTEAQVKTIFERLRSQLTEYMNEYDFMKRLAQATAKIKCGHTYVNPWNMKKSVRERLFKGAMYFPIGFEIIGKKFYATYNGINASAIQRGAEIISINGIESEIIYDSLATIAKYDGNNQAPIPYYLSLTDFRISNWEPFDLYFPIFFPFENEFIVEYKNFNSTSIQKTSIPALTKEDRFNRLQAKYGNEIGAIKEWTLDLSNPDVAVMRLGTFAIWNWKDFDFKKWFKESFAKLDSVQIQHLIIDIRGNGGGLSEPRDELLTYLVNEPIACDDRAKVLVRTTKVDTSLKPYSDTWEKTLFAGIPDSLYRPYRNGFYELKESFDCKEIKPKTKRYTGNVYLLGGSSNVSATFTLLERSKRLGIAKVLGETSGGNQQGTNGGSYIFFYMPYSGMEVDIPLKFFSGGMDQVDAGVDPDIFIKKSQKDIAENNDPHVQKVLALIARPSQNQDEKDYLNQLVSPNWKGTLTYLDYKSGNQVTIPSALQVNIINEKTYEFQYIYPDEPHANQKQSVKIDLEKNEIDGKTITKKIMEDDALILLAKQKGKDDGKPVMFFYTYIIKSNRLSIRKEYQRIGTNEKTMRNEYLWTK